LKAEHDVPINNPETIKVERPKSIRTLTALIGLFLLGCSRTVSVQMPMDGLHLAIYSQGHVIKECSLIPASNQYMQLNQLMANINNDWRPTLVSYAPSIYVTGTGITINFVAGSVILNYNGKQMAHTIRDIDYAFLNCSSF
jgi:hypothetical protein